MRKLVLFMHCSLDGFVGGPGGEMEWIHVDEEIFEYVGHKTDQSDTAIYGRNTYEMMEAYWPTAADQPGATKHDIQHSKWYMQVPKVVLSRTLKSPKKDVKVIRDDIGNEIAQLKNQKGMDMLIFGSPGAAHSLMEYNLIDDYWLFINPVLLGNGIPLFKQIQQRIPLKLMDSHAFSSGVVCLHYERS